MEEEWRPISHIADWIFISNLGRVKSADHIVNYSRSGVKVPYTVKGTTYSLRHEGQRNYLDMSFEGTKVLTPVDFLVYKYFVDFCVDENTVIFHKDGDHSNDNLDNLSLAYMFEDDSSQSGECWKNVSHIADWLFVSNLGRVKSVDHISNQNNRSYIYKGRYYSTWNCGYLPRVDVIVNGVLKHMYVDFLLYKYFIDESVDEKTPIFHKDGDYRNNDLDNLSLVSVYKASTGDPNEIWKPITDPRFYGRYEVSNKGHVRSLEWFEILQGSLRISGSKIFEYEDDGRYKCVTLKSKLNNKAYYPDVHRLVAVEFIPNPDNKPFINHKDFNPSNNAVENLEWCTQKENLRYSSECGRLKDLNGIKITCAEDDVEFPSMTSADVYYGFSPGTVSNVLLHRNGYIDGKHFIKI